MASIFTQKKVRYDGNRCQRHHSHVCGVLVGSRLCRRAARRRAIPDSTASSHSLSPATALVLVVLVLLFFAIGFSSVYIHRCSDSPPPLPIAAILAPAPRSSSAIGAAHFFRSRRPSVDACVMDMLPTFAYREAKGREDWIKGVEECAVCLSKFEESDTLRLLPQCGHAFHTQCIDKWLAKRAACPVCRSTVAVEG